LAKELLAFALGRSPCFGRGLLIGLALRLEKKGQVGYKNILIML